MTITMIIQLLRMMITMIIQLLNMTIMMTTMIMAIAMEKELLNGLVFLIFQQEHTNGLLPKSMETMLILQ